VGRWPTPGLLGYPSRSLKGAEGVAVLDLFLLAQGTTPDPSAIIDAAARGDVSGLLVGLCFLLVFLFLGACGIIVKLINRIERDRTTYDSACDGMRDKHEAEVRKLYGDLLKLTTRVQRAVEKLANIDLSEDEEG